MMLIKKVGEKRGFLKTMEVFIAITIVFIFVLYAQKSTITKSDTQNYHVLKILSKDPEFRKEIFQLDNVCIDKGDGYTVNTMIDEVLPAFFDYKLCVYNVPKFNIESLPDKKIYVDTYFFSADLEKYSPRSVKLFYWK